MKATALLEVVVAVPARDEGKNSMPYVREESFGCVGSALSVMFLNYFNKYL